MLSIEFNDSMDMAEIARELEKILSTFYVKRLLLDMSHKQFVVFRNCVITRYESGT